MSKPLMPKATAVWLVDNTVITFEQIAAFCHLHPLEIQGVADGEVAQGIQGQDPVVAGQLTTAEIERCSADPTARLEMVKSAVDVPEPKGRTFRYTPVSRRQDRPNAIAWLIRYHPELSDAQISKLVGTTKPTILTVRDRSHWNMPNLKPADPVTLGLCRQIDLDGAVQKAQAKLRLQEEKEEKAIAKAKAAQLAAAQAAGMPSTLPTEEEAEAEEESPAEEVEVPAPEEESAPEAAPKNVSVSSVFGEPAPEPADKTSPGSGEV